MAISRSIIARLACWVSSNFIQELNGFLEVAQTFLLGYALPIRAGNFQTCRPKTAFVRLAAMNDGREFFHAHILARLWLEEKWFTSTRSEERRVGKECR